jgi:hypothetical protein
MRILALIIVLAAFPAFMALLASARARKWAFMALGALPILYAPLNLDASFISWPLWPGHARGLSVTMMDPLALAICIRCARGRASPPLLWAFAAYLTCLLPGLLLAGQFTPALFFFFQAMRVTLFFYAVYLAVLDGQLTRIAEGLALAVIASGLVSAYHALSGARQAAGILGHQNLTGFATNLCIPLLLALGLRTKRQLFLAAVAAGAIGAVAGGSRATIVFFAFAVSVTIFVTVLIRPTGRTWAVAGLSALGLAVSAPFAIQKLSERNVAGFQLDPERVAFERTAELMIEDHPWGVGLNQYVSIANISGYFDKAGVRWGYEARSTNVHNAYLLMRAEAGFIGLVGLLVWLLGPIVFAASAIFRKAAALREVSVASGVALVGAALHSQYEWVLVTATPQYLVSMMIGVAAAIAAHSARSNRRRNTRAAKAGSAPVVPLPTSEGRGRSAERATLHE